MPAGSLTVVGTGIQLGAHVTAEARGHLATADEVLHLVTEPATRIWIERLNPNARSLHPLYQPGRPRAEIYAEMVEEIMKAVRSGRQTCAAFYGHPGVFVGPSHEAVRQARAEGFRARMLPGVSAEDCLFADLGVDPASSGCVSYEASDFLMHGRAVDPTAALVLWQVTLIGTSRAIDAPARRGLRILADRLLTHYPADHVVVLYEAAAYPVTEPSVVRVRLSDLADAPLPRLASLYVPPCERPRVDAETVALLRALRVDGDAV